MTTYGGSNNQGVIFSLNPATADYTKLKDFNGSNGANPYGSLLQASDNKLYGMTAFGGKNQSGVIFSFNPATAAYTKLKDFGGDNGSFPHGSLMQATDSKLYGMAGQGGSGNVGVIFSFNPVSSAEVKVKDLGANFTGTNPNSGAIKARDGKLYGMTLRGGAFGAGTLYSFDPATAAYAKLEDFNGSSGRNPQGSLLQAGDGKLYGMTTEGGKENQGVIFSFDQATGTYTKLKNFLDSNGSYPTGSLIQASDGKLYGMTRGGGKKSKGVIFSFDPVTSAYTKLYDFDGTTGALPYGSLLQASNGKLYGMTAFGGSKNVGVIFSFDLPTNTLTKLKDFDGINGSFPYGSLMQASDGKLYGMTTQGGSIDAGIIFSFVTATNTFTKLKDFDGINGRQPYGSLIQSSDGKLYGLTTYGGSTDFGLGVAFSFNPANLAYTKLAVFERSSNGQYPQSFFTEVNSGCTADIYYKDGDSDGYGNINKDTMACVQPAGYVSDSSDCNDSDNTIYPGAPEIHDGKDNDCNGIVDDNYPKLKINDLSFAEGNTGSKTVKFKVTLSAASIQTVTVRYTAVNGTATAPADYSQKTATLTFDPGLKTRYVSVVVKGDTQVEGNETFSVVLSNPIHATIADGTATGTILNDDGTAKITAKQNNSSSGVPTISVSPNPAASMVQVLLSGYSGKVLLQLTDLRGKVLKQASVQTSGVKQLRQTFNVAGIAGGAYWIVAADANGSKQSVKLMVVH